MESFYAMHYLVRRVGKSPELNARADAPCWQTAESGEITRFLSPEIIHRPRTEFRILHNSDGLHGLFTVSDQYVRCIRDTYQSDVYKDACVEFFVKPKKHAGYFNFEMNCGGALLLSYIEDPHRTPDGFASWTPIPESIGSRVKIETSMPAIVDPEITDPVEWTLQFHIPFSIFEEYIGELKCNSDSKWTANFNKCAEDCSHPHWATWADLGGKLNFHLPEKFAPLHFE